MVLPVPLDALQKTPWRFAPRTRGYLRPVMSEPTHDEPIDDQVPVADAVEQRHQVGEEPPLSEHVEPTEVNEIAARDLPEDADPADWQDQQTIATTDDEWDSDV